MNGEASSSTAHPQYENDSAPHQHATGDEGGDRATEEEILGQRKIRAKRKRIDFLDGLLRELDMMIFLELITIYYLDCSFFWFFTRALFHFFLLTPLPDIVFLPSRDEHRAFLPLILFPFICCFVLHLTFSRPSAGEDTRGYLHGGLLIDFIGQQGPTSKLHLATLDICMLFLQLVMLSVHVKRRKLRRNLPPITGLRADEESARPPGSIEGTTHPDQDADAEERGVLRRADTLSDIDQGLDGPDGLLLSPQETSSNSSASSTDVLDALNSGQVVVADLHIINTLLQEHRNYQAYQQARADGVVNASNPLRSAGLATDLPGRRLRASIRMRLGGG